MSVLSWIDTVLPGPAHRVHPRVKPIVQLVDDNEYEGAVVELTELRREALAHVKETERGTDPRVREFAEAVQALRVAHQKYVDARQQENRGEMSFSAWEKTVPELETALTEEFDDAIAAANQCCKACGAFE